MGTFLLFVFMLSPLLAAAQAVDVSSPADSQERIKSLEERLSKLEGAPAKTFLSAFNPAMGMALDMVYAHVNDRTAFLFRAAELNVEAPIDPYLKGWGVITGTNGTLANATATIDIEEATLETTSLRSLTVRGGRLFANFGRMAHFHDHELPVVDRPNSLNNFVGGETRADGVEAQYLLPTDTYMSATYGMYDKMGTSNSRTDPQAGRPMDHLTYLGRLSAYADVGDNHSVELGLTEAWTPKRSMTDARTDLYTRQNTWRALSGLDFTYRYTPVSGGLYRGVIWGTEVLANNERRTIPCGALTAQVPATPLAPFNASDAAPCTGDRVRSFAGYSYIQVKLGPRFRAGFMADMTENLDKARLLAKTFTGFLTCDITEFQRLRLVYARAVNNLNAAFTDPNGNVTSRFAGNTIELQWTGVMGHHVHGFRDR